MFIKSVSLEESVRSLSQPSSFLRAIALMMEAARTSETLVNFYQTTRCYNPEDSNLLCFSRLLQAKDGKIPSISRNVSLIFNIHISQFSLLFLKLGEITSL
jgi:hypothetical protein